MHKRKPEAFALREKGLNYNDISRSLGVSKSTLSLWFSKNEQFLAIRDKNIAKNRRESADRMVQTNLTRQASMVEKCKQTKKEAVLEFEEHKANPLFYTSLALYWGEGDKRSKYNVRIANIDPGLVKIFSLFLEKILKVDKTRIKAGLLIYPDLDDNICQEYWSKNIGLDRANFYKTMVLPGGKKRSKLNYGVCSLGISSGYLKQKLLVWIDLMRDSFV